MVNAAFTRLRWFYFLIYLKFYAPIALIYFAHVSGSWVQAASIIAIVQISVAVFEIPTGILSDYVGRKRTMVLGAGCGLLGVLSYTIGDYGWLVIGAVFEGISRAFYSGNNTAYLYDMLVDRGESDQYVDYLGKLYATVALAEVITAFAGGFLAAVSYPLLMWLSVTTQVVAFLLSLSLYKTDTRSYGGNIYRHLVTAFHTFWHNPRLRLLGLSAVLGNGIGMTAWHLQSTVYHALWPLWAVGVVRAFQSGTAIVGGYVSGPLVARLRAPRVIMIGSIYSWLTNIVPALFVSPISPILIASSPLFDGPQTTATETLLQKEFSDQQRATMGSLTSFVGSLFYAFFAYVMGLVADQIGPLQTLVVVQLCFLLVLVVNWRLICLIR